MNTAPTDPHDTKDEKPFGEDSDDIAGNDPDSGSPLNPAAHDEIEED